MASRTSEVFDFVGTIPAAPVSGEWRWPNAQFYPAAVLQIAVSGAATTITFSVSIDGGITFYLMDGWNIVDEVHENGTAFANPETKRYVFPIAAMTDLRLVKGADASVVTVIGRAYSNDAGLLNFSGTVTGIGPATPNTLTYWNTPVTIASSDITIDGGDNINVPGDVTISDSGCLILEETAGDQTETLTICAGDSMSANYKIELPESKGAVGDALLVSTEAGGDMTMIWGPIGGAGNVTSVNPLVPNEAMVRVLEPVVGFPQYVEASGTPLGTHILVRRELLADGSERRIDNIKDINLTENASNNTWYGFGSLHSVLTRTGADLATGTGLTAFGDSALAGATSGFRNTAFGYNALASMASGGGNVAIGANTLDAATGIVSNFNVAIGDGAMSDQTNGAYNVCVGAGADENGTTTSNCVYIGGVSHGVGIGTTQFNVGLGLNTLRDATTGGNQNVAIGRNTLQVLTTGGGNVAIGDVCGNAITTESYNILIGFQIPAVATDAARTIIGQRGLQDVIDPPHWVVRPEPCAIVSLTADNSTPMTYVGHISTQTVRVTSSKATATNPTVWDFPALTNITAAVTNLKENDTFDVTFINTRGDGDHDIRFRSNGVGVNLIVGSSWLESGPIVGGPTIEYAGQHTSHALFRLRMIGTPPTSYTPYRIS